MTRRPTGACIEIRPKWRCWFDLFSNMVRSHKMNRRMEQHASLACLFGLLKTSNWPPGVPLPVRKRIADNLVGPERTETRPEMKNDLANWKPKRSENWCRNFRLEHFGRRLRFLPKLFCLNGTCNRFLNANKCHQSIFIIMVLWLIALDFSRTNGPLNENHWKQSIRRGVWWLIAAAESGACLSLTCDVNRKSSM